MHQDRRLTNTLPIVLDLHGEEAGFLAVLRDYALRAPHDDLDLAIQLG